MKKILAFLFVAGVVASAAFWLWRNQQAANAAMASATAPADSASGRVEARWYEKLPGGRVQCRLCPNFCRLGEGRIGACRVRQNIGGTLYTLAYGRIAALHVDPVEKKPFFHVLPGSRTFSLATPGCNLRCLFCQNWEISQAYPWQVRTTELTPEQVVEAALASGAPSISFTYTEPTIFYEYMYDIARLAREKGLKTLVISAGFINPEPLRELLPHIDAYKIDFKAFNPDFYTRLTGGNREPVLEAMKIIREQGVWLEIVNLLIPGQNDREEEIRALARWVKENLGPEVPVHFTRFHPMHKMQHLPPTPVETVVRAREIAIEEGLQYVYIGNVPGTEGASTRSPRTGEVVIERRGYFAVNNRLTNGVAPDGAVIPGVWK